jgi:hypothetical protein
VPPQILEKPDQIDPSKHEMHSRKAAGSITPSGVDATRRIDAICQHRSG